MGQQQSRMTKQRAVILEELRNVKSHPTADELYGIVRRRLPKISLGTVYRNLDFLAEHGEIIRLDPTGTTRRFDGDMAPHHHVRCVYCGCIADIMQPVSMPLVDGISVQGFAAILASRVEFEGICDRCANSDVAYSA